MTRWKRGSGRAPLPSPGRPPVAGRNELRRFWAAIAQACRVKMPRPAPRYLKLSERDGSGRQAECHQQCSGHRRSRILGWRAQGCTVQEVARRIGRAASTISRELRRNAATRSGGLEYRASTAQWHAERSARRPRQAKLVLNAALQAYVQDRLAGLVEGPSGVPVPGPSISWKGRRHGPRQDRRWARAWSPEQIARRLPVDFPDDITMRISHEAIYSSFCFVSIRAPVRERRGAESLAELVLVVSIRAPVRERQ
jgi:hypothetical protein